MIKDDRADFAFRTSYDDTYLRWPANPRGPRRPPDELEMAEGTIKGPTMYTTHYSDLSHLPENERRMLETRGSCSNLAPTSPREVPGVIEMGGDPRGDTTCGVTCGKFPAQGDKSVRPESFICATKYNSFFRDPPHPWVLDRLPAGHVWNLDVGIVIVSSFKTTTCWAGTLSPMHGYNGWEWYMPKLVRCTREPL